MKPELTEEEIIILKNFVKSLCTGFQIGETEEEDQNKLLTPDQAAKKLKIAVKTVYNKCSKNAANPFPFKPIRLGNRLRFKLEDIQKYISNN